MTAPMGRSRARVARLVALAALFAVIAGGGAVDKAEAIGIPPAPAAAAPCSKPTEPMAERVKVEVRLAEGRFDRAFDGRLLVILSRERRSDLRGFIGLPLPGAPMVAGVDISGFSDDDVAMIDADAASFPPQALDSVEPGRWYAQAVLKGNPDLWRIDAPGNPYSDVVPVRIGPEGGVIRLELNRAEAPDHVPDDSEYVRYLKFRSKRLSDFHGRPIFLRAAVIVPKGFEEEPDRHYPLRVHIGGFGSRYTSAAWRMAEGASFREHWLGEGTPRFVMLVLDGAGPFGDPYQVNSANNGPYGDAVVHELIPHVERAFRGIGTGASRVLDGGSTGGWVALALQIFYPEAFNGAWASCPDSVDFRSFQLINIYEDENAYVRNGRERPAFRARDGRTIYTMRDECQLENALGLGDSWALSGGQWGSWNAVYGPRGADGRPAPLWDPRTGAIDRSALAHWKRYDLRRVLEANWDELGPKLSGKLRIWVGEADNFFLEDAAHRLEAFLETADPPADATIVYGEGEGHCWSGISEAEMLEQMAAAVGQGR